MKKDMKMRNLYLLIVLVLVNCNSFMFAQSSTVLLYLDERYAIPIIEIINRDTVFLDTVYNTHHSGESKRCIYNNVWEKYLEYLGINTDLKERHGLSVFEEYSKTLSHNSTIIVMEPTIGGIYKINQCKVNGVVANSLCLDTGAASLSISEAFEKELKDKNAIDTVNDYKSPVKSIMANGEVVIKKRVVIKEFEIGGIKLYNIMATITPGLKAPMLLGQTVLSRLFAYTIMDDRLIIMRENPNYDLGEIEQLLYAIYDGVEYYYPFADNYDELKLICERIIEDLLKLERMCELDALHLLYLATCYYESGDYEKCVRTCYRFQHAINHDKESGEEVFQHMNAAICSLLVKSKYYMIRDTMCSEEVGFEDCIIPIIQEEIIPIIQNLTTYEPYMDSNYYRTIKYFSAICNYFCEDYRASEQDLKQSVERCQYKLSNNFGYWVQDTVLLSKMFLDFSLWSYEIGEKKHGDVFLRNSCCLNNQYASEIMQKHPALYGNGDWAEECRLKIYDLFLYACEGYGTVSTPLVGRQFRKIKAGEEDWQYYFYDKKARLIFFDE